ncbi:MAG TPA: rhodanese-like domain-containing protein [Turneriella sp.]|nr:rhodanese-like domain-containing protein [Turneriella sp.]
MVEQISVFELKKKLDNKASITLVDVRQVNELDICKLPEAKHIPLHILMHRLDELDRSSEIIMMCHGGGRSQRAAEFLVSQGFTNVANLVGGIDAWAAQIDSNMARY